MARGKDSAPFEILGIIGKRIHPPQAVPIPKNLQSVKFLRLARSFSLAARLLANQLATEDSSSLVRNVLAPGASGFRMPEPFLRRLASEYDELGTKSVA